MDSSIRASFQRPLDNESSLAKIGDGAKESSRSSALTTLGSAVRLKLMNSGFTLPKQPTTSNSLLAFVPAFKKAANMLIQTTGLASQTASLGTGVKKLLFHQVLSGVKIALSKLSLKFEAQPSLNGVKNVAQFAGKVGDLGSSALSAVGSSAQKVYANLQTALNGLSKNESSHQTEVNTFLEQFDKQISQEEQKLQQLERELPTLKNEMDRGDAKQKIDSLKETIPLMKSIRQEVQKSGVKVLEKMNNEQAKDLEAAKTAARATIDQAGNFVSKFASDCGSLIDKAPLDESKKLELKSTVKEKCNECRQNLQACEARQASMPLWGLLAVWKPQAETGKLSTEKLPSAREMVNKATTPSRLNSSEVMPSFIEQFQKEVLMEKMFTPLGLQRPGGSTKVEEGQELSPAEQTREKNKQIFKGLTPDPAVADKLFKAYESLWQAYGARSADPQKFLTLANQFMDDLNAVQSPPVKA